MSRKAAILGLGGRGSVWAELFRDAGWRVSGFDPDPSATGLPRGSRGWRREDTISTTVAHADWVVFCLPDRLELMQKVIQRAQAEAPAGAVMAVTTHQHDVDSVQNCATRSAEVVLITGAPGQGVGLNVSGRNPSELKLDALAVLSEVCSSPILPPDDAARAVQDRDSKSA